MSRYSDIYDTFFFQHMKSNIFRYIICLSCYYTEDNCSLYIGEGQLMYNTLVRINIRESDLLQSHGLIFYVAKILRWKTVFK